MGGTWPTGKKEDRETLGQYQPGDFIAGKYRLNRVLGSGGAGSVWLASNTILEVDVAIKLLHSDFAGQEEAGQRFLSEARATAKLRHPGIVRLHDFGTTAHGHAFMVMEHLNGESLADMLERRGKIAPIEAVQLLLQVLDALDLAHDHGIVHRDLKPENILVVRQGDAYTCKVVDFGIAKVANAPSSRRSPPASAESLDSVVLRSVSRLTQHGTILGSPQYMAPEQARGSSEVDHRADVWGFCVCLYECVNGERPFEKESIDQLLLSVLTDEPLQPDDADADLWQLIRRGLEKDPEHRWQFASYLGEALANWLISNGVEVDASGRSVRSRWLGEASIAEHAQKPRVSTVVAHEPTADPLIMSPTPSERSNMALVVGSVVTVAAAVGVTFLVLSGSTNPGRQEDPVSEAAAEAIEAPTAEALTIPVPSASVVPVVPPSSKPAPPAASSVPSASSKPALPAYRRRPVPWPRAKPKPTGGLPLPEDADF